MMVCSLHARSGRDPTRYPWVVGKKEKLPVLAQCAQKKPHNAPP